MQVYDKTQVRPLTLNSISDEAHTCSSNACFCCFVVAKSVFTFASCFDRSVSYKNKPKVLIRQWAPCIQCQRHETNRSEEHTSELQSRQYLVCRLLLEKKKKNQKNQKIKKIKNQKKKKKNTNKLE